MEGKLVVGVTKFSIMAFFLGFSLRFEVLGCGRSTASWRPIFPGVVFGLASVNTVVSLYILLMQICTTVLVKLTSVVRELVNGITV